MERPTDATLSIAPQASLRRGQMHPVFILVLLSLVGAAVFYFAGDKLLASLGEAFEGPVTVAVVAVLIALGVIGNSLRKAGHRAAISVLGVAERVRSVPSAEDRHLGLKREQLDEIATHVCEANVGNTLARQWLEFRESLVRDDERYFNPIEAGRFFSDDEFEAGIHWSPIGNGVSYSFVHELPSFMTSLGMLGTFIGIAIGLGALASLDDGGVMVDKISGVIAGLASAFWTSIFGLVAASLTTWLNHRADDHMSHAMVHLRLELDRSIPRRTSEQLLESQVSESYLQTEELQSIVGQSLQQNELLESLIEANKRANEYLYQMSNDMAEQIAQGTGKVINDTLGPLLNKMIEIVTEQITKASERSEETFSKLTDLLSDKIAGAISDSVEQIGDHASDIATSFGGLSVGLEAAVGNAMKQAETGMVTIAKRMTNTFDGTMDAMDRRVVSAVSKMGQQIEGVSATLASSVEGTMNGVTKHVETASANLASSVDDVMATVSKQIETASNSLASSIDGLMSKVSSGLEDTAVAVSAKLKTAANEASAAIAKAIGSLPMLARVFTIAVGELNEVTTTMTSVHKAFTESATTFKDATIGVAPMIRTLASVGATLKHATEALDNGLATIKDSLTSAEKLRLSLESIADQSTTGLRDASGELRSVADSLRGISGDFRSWVDDTGTSLERFATTMNMAMSDTLRTYDGHLSQALKGLGQSAREFDRLASNISRDLRSRDGRSGGAGRV